MQLSLYARTVTERIAAIEQCSPEKDVFPRACWGSLNAFLVVIGPSPGAPNPGQERWPGGRDRPVDQNVSTGDGLGDNPFGDSNRRRANRWNKVLRTAFLDERQKDQLTALFNLDWGHAESASKVPSHALAEGCPIVYRCLERVKPRVVIALTWSVFRTFHHYMLSTDGIDCSPVRADCLTSAIVRLNGTGFDTLFIRSPNHPSRHFLTDSKISLLQSSIKAFLQES